MGQHHPAQHHEVPAQLERAPLHHLDLRAALIEQRVFEVLDAVIELLHGSEVTVDENVEQPVQQERHTVFGQVR